MAALLLLGKADGIADPPHSVHYKFEELNLGSSSVYVLPQTLWLTWAVDTAFTYQIAR